MQHWHALLTLGFLTLPLQAAPAPVSLAGDEVSAGEAPDPRSEKRRRILHFADGQILRAKSHLEDGTWFVEAGDRTVEVSASAITRAPLERAVLQEMKARRKRLRVDDHIERFLTAEWMVAEGLHEESLSTFDRILARFPDHPQALDLLTRVRYAVALPMQGPYETLDAEGLTRLVHFAGSSVPTAQEYVVELLREHQDPELVREAVGKLLFTGLERPRAFATLAQRRLFPGEQQRALLGRAVIDRSAKVRLGAALALSRVEQPGIVVPVVRAMEDSESEYVRWFAAEALGHMGHAAAVEPLVRALATLAAPQTASGGGQPASNIYIGEQVAYVSDYDIEIAQGASIADPQINVQTAGVAFTARSLGISGYTVVKHRESIMTSLRQLTGEDAGKRTRDWLEWWDEHGERWLSSKHSSPK